MAYLTPEQIRARHEDLRNEPKFPAAMLAGHVAEFEPIAERARGQAFEPRPGETVKWLRHGARRVLLDHQLVHADGLTVTVDGDPFDLEDLDYDLDGTAGIFVAYGRGFPRGRTVFTYTHGHATPPPAIQSACLLFVWHSAMARLNPDTGNSWMTSNPELGLVERASTADWAAGRFTGWMDVDGILQGVEDLRRDEGP